MRLNWQGLSLSVLLVFGSVALADDDERIAAAYDAILRGDYAAGEAVVTRLADSANPAVGRLREWLAAYRDVVDGRDELRANTLAWNAEHAKEAVANGKVFLALSFAAQAAQHAADRDAFSIEAWVQDLTTKARAEAEQRAASQNWTKVRPYYRLLTRVHPEDEEIKELEKLATRHARLEILYADEESVQRRLEGVSDDLLKAALYQIDRNYYEKPSFKELAEGALDYLDALCTTPKLFDVFDGLGNPVLRSEFQQRLAAQREKLAEAQRFSRKDLERLYGSIAGSNKALVELPAALITVEFLEGVVERLDRFTAVVWPTDAKEFDKALRGNFKGVGIQLGVDERTGRLKVVTPLANSPALEAGVRADDLIVEVDGQSTKKWTSDDAVREITGPAGSVVTLTMFRPSTKQRISFPLTRREIKLTTVRGVHRTEGAGWNFMLDEKEGVAYVRLTSFNPDSQRELANALHDAEGQGMKGLILDLRYNPGGLLDVALTTVSTFLSEGEVLSTRGRREAKQRFKVESEAEFGELPLVVMVNEGSASASEILAGALRDHHRTIVLGERTYGKGSVQRVLPLGEAARLKLTTALYYLPNGRSPHKTPGAEEWGVDPDCEVELMPKEVLKVMEAERKVFIIHNGDEQGEPTMEDVDAETVAALKGDEQEDDEEEDPPLLTEDDIAALDDPHKAPDVDPQLETALLLLRTKLAGKLPWPKHLAARPTEQTAADAKP